MSKYLDLRGIPCPVNFVQCRLALEELNEDQILQVDLDRGEPEEMVILGLKEEGCQIESVIIEPTWIRLLIIPNGKK